VRPLQRSARKKQSHEFRGKIAPGSTGWWVALRACVILPRLVLLILGPWNSSWRSAARHRPFGQSVRCHGQPSLHRRAALDWPQCARHADLWRGEFGGASGCLLRHPGHPRGVLGRRGPLPSPRRPARALALGSMPLFVLEARQLTSDMPLVAGWRWPWAGWAATPGRRRRAPLARPVVAGVGLMVGLLSGGALWGVALPCLAFTAAILAGWGLRPRPADDPRPAS